MARPCVVEQVALVEHHEIRAGDLGLEHLHYGVVVFARGVLGARARQRRHVGGDASLGERRAVHHRNDAVHRDAAPDRRPAERLHQRLGQREAGGFDHDVLDGGLLRQDKVERRHEGVRHRATQAAIGELDDVVGRAGGVGAALEDVAVDADVAELVDDHGEAAALRVGEHVTDQRRLAGAEKAGDDGAGHAGEGRVHSALSGAAVNPNGGVRATSPRLSAAGRPRHGINPSDEWANSRAPSISASAPVAASRWPNT